ncbi:MAG: hypothetical protein ACXIUD_17010 [Mongoliitalea sp.]
MYLNTIAIGLLGSVVYFFLKKRSLSTTNWVLLATLGIVLILETIGFNTSRQKINNSFYYNIGFIHLESLLLIAYFYFLAKSSSIKKTILQVTGVLIVWGIFVSIFLQDIQSTFQFFAFFPYIVFILFLAVRLLNQLVKQQVFENTKLVLIPHFWIGLFITLFYSVAIFIFGTFQFHPEFVTTHSKVIFGFNRLLAGTMYLVFGFAFFIPLICIKSQDSNSLT